MHLPPHGWAGCWMSSRRPTGSSGSMRPPAEMRCLEQLVTARIIEPTSKQDAARVLAEAGVRALSNRTVKRSCRGMPRQEWRDRLSGACTTSAALGPSALVIYEVTALWFETGAGDGFREPGPLSFSKGGDADDGRPHMN